MATTNLGRVAIVHRGAYNAATAYVVLDSVSLNGSSYLCIAPCTNKDPETETAYWALMASKGDTGDPTSSTANDIPITDSGSYFPTNTVEAALQHIGLRLSDLIANVKNYGAVGDGIADDTAAIQAAVDTNKNLYFPFGTYLIKNTTAHNGIKPASSTKWTCAFGTILKLGSSRCNIVSNFIDDFMETGNTHIVDFEMSGFILDCNKDNLVDPHVATPEDGDTWAGDNYSYGVYLCNGKNVTLKECTFKNSWYGGFNLYGIDGQNIIGNTFDNIGDATAHFGKYVAFGSDGSPRAASRNVNVQNNRCINCGGYRANGGANDGAVYSSENWDISHNDFGTQGVTMFGGKYKNVSISRNIMQDLCSVTGEGEAVTEDTSLEDIRIEDNTINCVTALATNKAYLYVRSITSFKASRNIINVSIDSPLGYLMVIDGEYDGSAVVPPTNGVVENNQINAMDIKNVFLILRGKVALRGNHVYTDAVGEYVVNSSATTDLVSEGNHFKVASGAVWNKGGNAKIWRNNTGYNTMIMGVRSAAVGGHGDSILHGFGVAPAFVSASAADGSATLVTTTTNTSYIIFACKNLAGAPVYGIAVNYFAVSPYYQEV